MSFTNLKDKFYQLLGIVFIVFFFYEVIFKTDLWHVLIYVVIGYCTVFLILNLLFKTKYELKQYLLFFIFICIITFSFFSGSNFLKEKDFVLFHPKWQRAEIVRINDCEIKYFHRRKRQSYAYSVLKIEYQYNGAHFTSTVDLVNKQFPLIFWLDDRVGLEQITESKLIYDIDQQHYQLYFNPAHPEQIQFFQNTHFFDLRASGFGFYMVFVQFLFLILIFVLIYQMLTMEIRSESKIKNRSKKRKLKKALKMLFLVESV